MNWLEGSSTLITCLTCHARELLFLWCSRQIYSHISRSLCLILKFPQLFLAFGMMRTERFIPFLAWIQLELICKRFGVVCCCCCILCILHCGEGGAGVGKPLRDGGRGGVIIWICYMGAHIIRNSHFTQNVCQFPCNYWARSTVDSNVECIFEDTLPKDVHQTGYWTCQVVSR